ncbi:FAD dependent oxidoreductase [Exidia glandulosa HHB12029]|uniref:FAD dependent oxidoreductase n=1 Tax=Exidia glandulosa HHB12029 TaxID=1314781 RepID=A0A165MW03_EXIGL|nr:FAD dependent oxidoreductase [Exidia glandulosa HHB12029]
MTAKKHIVVLGAGVIGLSTAVHLLETKRDVYDVTIIADALPSDDRKSGLAHYASLWAGAQHVSFASLEDTLQQQLDRATFKRMWEMSDPSTATSSLFMRLKQTEYYRSVPSDVAQGKAALDFMPDFRYLKEEELADKGAKAGLEFTTVTIDVPTYLAYLLARALALGGRLLRARVMHISQVYSGAFTPTRPVDAVIVCTGLGARSLGGVEDLTVFPIRGQTVLIKAPWVDWGVTLSGSGKHKPGEELLEPPVYVIPRASGEVIIGGAMEPDDYFPLPRAGTTKSILERALKLAPQLVQTPNPTLSDLEALILEEGCGFRPGRRDGIRLEAGKWEDKVVVYNYGHAGQGYQSSWGSAEEAVRLLDAAFA